jgi:hypothetical protein
MFQMSKEDAIQFLHEAKERLSQAKTKEETLAVLGDAGSQVGYTPAFRALVAGVAPEDSIRWKQPVVA